MYPLEKTIDSAKGVLAATAASPAGDIWSNFAATLRTAGKVTFWWRDDDVGGDARWRLFSRRRHERCLAKMLSLLARYNIPAVFAVIPNKLDACGAKQVRLLRQYGAYAALHGLTHRNNAANGAASEFPEGCDVETNVSAILAAQKYLKELLGDRLLPVFVPPWNNISAALEKRLLESGFAAISKMNGELPECQAIHADVDLLDWQSRDLRDEGALLSQIAHLATRSTGGIGDGSAEPVGPTIGPTIGLMNHHRCLTDRAYAFFDKFFRVTTSVDTVTWGIPPEFFPDNNSE